MCPPSWDGTEPGFSDTDNDLIIVSNTVTPAVGGISSGEYYFRTIKPVPYPSRPAPHIRFLVRGKGCGPWTIQPYIKGHPGNQRDRICRGIRDATAQEAIIVVFLPAKESRIGELTAKFDIVLGLIRGSWSTC